MRTFKKLVVLIVAAIAIIIFTVGFFGVSTKFGDISTTYVNAAKNIQFDADFTNTATVVFSPSSETGEDIVPTDEELNTIKTVMEKRLERMRVSDFNVRCDYENGKILVEMPLTNSVVSSYSWVLSVLGATGDVIAIEGNPETIDGREPVFTSDNVLETTFDYEQDFFSVYYLLDMKLDSEGKAALREATTNLKEELDATEDVQYITIWYGGTRVSAIRINDVIKNGRITLRSATLDENTLNELMVYLNSGSLPYAMSYSSVYSGAGAYGEESVHNVSLALLGGFAVIFLYLIIRFRLIGFSGVIMTLGTVGFTMFFITGFMIGRGIPGTTASMAALILVALICVETTIRNGNAVRNKLKGRSVIAAVPDGLKSTFVPSIIVYAVVLLLAILLVLCRAGGEMAWLLRRIGIGSTGLLAIGTFGSVLIAGICCAFVFNVLCNRLMVNSLMETIKKPAMYGGGKHE